LETVGSPTYYDIVVVGGGLAGTTAAALLGQQGFHVMLVEARATCPPVFKAEKIEPDQVQLFRKFNLAEDLLARAVPIRKIQAYYNGRLFQTVQTQQYGTYYSDLVNSLRSNLPSNVQFRAERAVDITNGPDLQCVKLASGEEFTCRLVVLACGVNGEIPLRLGLKRSYVQRRQSVAIAFTIARLDSRPFPFDSATYYAVSPKTAIDYLSLFRIGRDLRANLFAFPNDDSWTSQFLQEPTQTLKRCLPKLERAIGAYQISSKVESAIIHLYRTPVPPLPGIVLIGDAAQNVCPSTGIGLTKILTDADVLCFECIPMWFKSDGMGAHKTQSFFDHPRKLAVDTQALQNAYYRRQACTALSARWRVHRAKLHLTMRLRRPGRDVSHPVSQPHPSDATPRAGLS
jgi:2-polyprenyl-6-methoxyphenol hydroxylase-like FAD-dependent oxidoreductase